MCPAYLIDDQRFESDSLGFNEALADAHAAHKRPHCLCVHGGREMYVARLGDTYIIKRMPNTGSDHAPDCPSYEPPADVSGLGQVLGSAIKEDPTTGLTTLRLGFSLVKTGGRSTSPVARGEDSSVASDGTKLTLRGLLHYLWDQAELTKWHPGFAGKRSWATVRRHILAAAENKLASGEALRDRLYVPEAFSVDRREEINARRITQWLRCRPHLQAARHLMVLIAEVKEITPAKFGFKAVIKHVPDQAFALDAVLYRRMTRRFEGALSLWAASDTLHMIIIATFDLNQAGVPTIEELSVMPTTREWIPVDDRFELGLLEKMVEGGRRFVKTLRYNGLPGEMAASAVLLDTEGGPLPRYINSMRSPPGSDSAHAGARGAAWTWDASRSLMPALPEAATRRG